MKIHFGAVLSPVKLEVNIFFDTNDNCSTYLFLNDNSYSEPQINRQSD